MSGAMLVGLSIVACYDISGGYGEQNGKFGSGSRLEFGRLQAMKSVSDPPGTNALSRQGCSRLRGIIIIWTPADIDCQALLLLQHVSRLRHIQVYLPLPPQGSSTGDSQYTMLSSVVRIREQRLHNSITAVKALTETQNSPRIY